MSTFPGTPPSLPHSISSPSLSSPQTRSPHPKNFHPYRVHTTTSSLLTRSNSSPAQPIHTFVRHKSSSSTGSLGFIDSPSAAGIATPEMDTPTNRRRSAESPRIGGDTGERVGLGMRRSTRSMRFEELMSPSKEKERALELPLDPKLWTPAELAIYLAQTLRNGGPDGCGQILPGPLVEDIKTWVLRQQISGRAFLRGNAEAWTQSSHSTPFMPLLMSISRRLRRSSLQGRMSKSDSTRSISGELYREDLNAGPGSVLLEEEEVPTDDENQEREITGVRRMAQAIESRDAASDASGDEGPEKLKAQWTGGSSSSAGCRHWEMRRRNIVEGTAAPAFALPRQGSAHVSSAPLDLENFLLGREQLSASSEETLLITPMEELAEETAFGTGKIGTVKASSLRSISATSSKSASSPLPSYTGDDASSPAKFPARDRNSTPMALPPRGDDGESATPTPERPRPAVVKALSGLGLITGEKSEKKSTSRAVGTFDRTGTECTAEEGAVQLGPRYGIDSHATLRHTSSTGGTRQLITSALRRIQLDEGALGSSSDACSASDGKIDIQLSTLVSRIQELESRLATAEGERDALALSVPNTPMKSGRPISPIMSMFPSAVFDKLGLSIGQERDSLPTRIGELPAYLFLVGVGVGCVMMRVLLGRGR